MDTSKFELTDEKLTEQAEMLYNFRNAMTIEGIKSVLWQLSKQQAKQILSLFEPVELEALGDEEIMKHYIQDSEFATGKRCSQATIRHNQKGQLYRIRSEKE